LPIGYQIWLLYSVPNFNTMHERLCAKTAFLQVLVTVETTLLAQVVLTLRIYAVTSKNRIITSFLCVITISQLILGLHLTYSAATHKLPWVTVALIYMTCVAVTPWPESFVFPIISLVYDLIAFSVIVYLAVRSNIHKVPIPSLLRIIVQDATYYFLVIFTSHLVVTVYLWFGPVRISSSSSILSLWFT